MKAILLALFLAIPATAQVPGDVNHSGQCDVSDVVSLIQYIFNGVPLPEPPATWKNKLRADLDSMLVEWPDSLPTTWYIAGDTSSYMLQLNLSRKPR